MIPPPRCRRLRLLGAMLGAALLLPALGCARTGSVFPLNPRRGSMRESLSRLEFQNQQLKDELKVAREEQRRLESDLQLAEIDNRDLESRLESYRTQLGLNGGGSSPVNSYDLAKPDRDSGVPDFRSTRPASQPPSRAPFTRIPNPSAIDVTPPPGPAAEDAYRSQRSSNSYEDTARPYIDPPPVRYFDLSPSASRADLDRTGDSTWYPLARGSSRSGRYD